MQTLVATPRSRITLAVAVMIAAAGVFFMSPAARAQGSQILQSFRVQRFMVINFDQSQSMRALPDLAAFGSVAEASQGRTRPVASAEEAGNLAGLTVRLPGGDAVSSEPQLTVIEPSSMSFTFDVERAREHLAATGETAFHIPERFNGAVLSATMPAVVVAQYGGRAGRYSPGPEMFGPETLIVIQGRSPSAAVSGRVNLEDMRQLLLSMPGLPADTVAQLRGIDDWTTTMPIPVPRNIGIAHEVQVNGRQGLAIADNTGAGGLILWTEGGVVYGVGGGKTADELLRIASTLA